MKTKIFNFSLENIDNAISGGIRKQIILLFAFTSIVLIGGFILVLLVNELSSIWSGEKIWEEDPFWNTYTIFADSGNMEDEEGLLNRILAAIISLSGSIMLSGVLISTISNIMERRVEAIRTGKVTYKNISNHYVIIGFNEITISLIKEIYKDSIQTKTSSLESDFPTRILLMSSQETESIRHTLQAQLDREEEKIVKVYFGNIEAEEELRRLNIHLAKEIYILGEKDEYGRDSKNIGCVHYVSKLRGNTTNPIPVPVYVQFDRISSYSNIQKLTLRHIEKDVLSNIFFRPFNFYENWARLLWSLYTINNPETGTKKSALNYPSLDYRPIRISDDCKVNDTNFVHLVIVGFNKMGRALLLEALRICHYANYDDTQPQNERIRTIITLVDKNIDEMKDYFMAQFPYIEKQIDDIQIEYRNEDICSPKIRQDLETWSKDEQRMMTIAVCISDPDMSLSLGLNFPSSIYENGVHVLIRQELHTDLGRFIDEDNGKYKNIRIFGMLDQGIQKNMLQDTLATYINQYYNCKYCSNYPECIAQEKMNCIFAKNIKRKNYYIRELYKHCISKTKDYEYLQECAFHSWFQLDEIMRWANRYQLDAYPVYCRTLGYDITKDLSDSHTHFTYEEKRNIIKALPVLMRMEKHRWNAERTIEGWRYGKAKNTLLQTHPLILPFSELIEKHPEEAMKDKDVIKNLPYLFALGGFYIKKTL